MCYLSMFNKMFNNSCMDINLSQGTYLNAPGVRCCVRENERLLNVTNKLSSYEL